MWHQSQKVGTCSGKSCGTSQSKRNTEELGAHVETQTDQHWLVTPAEKFPGSHLSPDPQVLALSSLLHVCQGIGVTRETSLPTKLGQFSDFLQL